ncbi:MAG TPA: MBL fold metallo-hydrolase [Gemmatimonadales bacterium]|nr:MBL fold metallo-hydrolase [Gemmatimonadales bacterium]
MPRSSLVPAARSLALLALPLVVPGSSSAQLQTMSVTRLAEGVYGAIYSEMKRDPVQSNSLIIIGDDGVCVVDAHYTPSAARATIAEIRKLTRLPVRYLVTTHWHDDHIFGNQEYRKAYPGVTLVAQKHVYESMVAGAQEHRDGLVKAYSRAVVTAETRLRTGLDREGKPLSPELRADLTEMLPVYRSYARDFEAVHIVLPDLTFDKEVTLHLGQREIRVISFGAGNTRGDAVIYLPREKIAAVGDLVVYPVPFIYGGFPASWVRVLQSVRDLAPAIIVPGHGPVMRDFAYLDQVSGLLQSMATQASDAVVQGLTLEQTRQRMDLTTWHDRFVAGQEEREGTFQASIRESGIKAAFDEAVAADSARRG